MATRRASPPVAGQQFEYAFDDIGNRQSTKAGGDDGGTNLRPAGYSVNALNQYGSREVPSYVNVLGTASNTATVTIWGDKGSYSPTLRKGEYFRGELYANNATGAVWLTITNVAVLNNGANPDIVTNSTGRVYVPKTVETFAYDADGNLTNDGRWSYTWDAENRITSFTRISSAPSGAKVKVDCHYDSRWRRSQKIVSAWNGSAYVAQSTNRFVYDHWNLVAILNHTNGLVYSFAWGTDASGTMQGAGGVGGLVSMTVHQGTNAGNYFYCYDGNHNVVALVNAANGSVAARYEYGAFGELLRATGPLAQFNPFLFSTKFYDWETGFYYYGYRYYDPDTGRWPSRDPIEDDFNLNLFVRNNPVEAIDFLGLSPQFDPPEYPKIPPGPHKPIIMPPYPPYTTRPIVINPPPAPVTGSPTPPPRPSSPPGAVGSTTACGAAGGMGIAADLFVGGWNPRQISLGLKACKPQLASGSSGFKCCVIIMCEDKCCVGGRKSRYFQQAWLADMSCFDAKQKQRETDAKPGPKLSMGCPKGQYRLNPVYEDMYKP